MSGRIIIIKLVKQIPRYVRHARRSPSVSVFQRERRHRPAGPPPQLSDRRVHVDDLSVRPVHRPVDRERHPAGSSAFVVLPTTARRRQVFRRRARGIRHGRRPAQAVAVRPAEGTRRHVVIYDTMYKMFFSSLTYRRRAAGPATGGPRRPSSSTTCTGIASTSGRSAKTKFDRSHNRGGVLRIVFFFFFFNSL